MKRISVLSAALLLAGSLMAADGYKYQITPMVGQNFADHDGALEDAFPMYGLRLSAYFNETVGIQLGYERADDVEYWYGLPGANETDVQRYFANLVFDGSEYQNFTPYFLIGGGYEDIATELDNEESQGFANAGVGVKYAVNDVLDLVLEGRWIHKLDSKDRDAVASLGFGFKFGREEAPAPAPAPVIVPEPAPEPAPQPKDSDGDGVLDKDDKCPGTPAGVVVDADGCPKDYTIKILFDFDKSDVKAVYTSDIDKVIEILKKDPSYKAVISGHTDSTGTNVYNQGLSERRANAVKNYIVNNGIAAERLRAVGYGEEKPVASNKTREGRAENRRVEANFTAK